MGRKLQCCIWLVVASIVSVLLLFGGLPVEQGRIKADEPKTEPEDDRLDDKHPVHVETFTNTADIDDVGVVLINRSDSVIGLDATDLTAGEKHSASGLYADFASALKQVPLVRDKYTGAMRPNILPSIDMLDAFTKYTDDRLLAAIETHVNDLTTVFTGGKQEFIAELAAEVMASPPSGARDEAAAFLLAAFELGGGSAPPAAAGLRPLIDSVLSEFEEFPEFSKPIGLYTGTAGLERIFRRDRLLQQPFGSYLLGSQSPGRSYPLRSLDAAVVIAEALQRRADLRQAYGRFLQLSERTSNPGLNLNMEDLLEHSHLFGNIGALSQALANSPKLKHVIDQGNPADESLGVAFSPFAASKEMALFQKLYDGELPSGNIMDDLTQAISDGDVDLTPGAGSGWYDYQLHALETLLLPGKAMEADKLLLKAKYKQRLKKAFEAMMILRRELHVKEIAILKTKGGRRIPPTPQLTVEPAATHYLRTARSYLMLRRSLVEILGTEAGDIRTDEDTLLIDELDQAITVFLGLYLICCEDLGMLPDFDAGEYLGVVEVDIRVKPETIMNRVNDNSINFHLDKLDIIRASETIDEARIILAAYSAAYRWLVGLDEHPAMQADPRVIVPVLASGDGMRMRCWAVTGVTFKRLTAWYARPPLTLTSSFSPDMTRAEADSLLLENRDGDSIEWDSISRLIPVYAFAEVEMEYTPLSREEFQALCDKHRTEKQIVAALKGEAVPAAVTWLLWAIGAAALLLLTGLAFRRWNARQRGQSS